MSNQSANHQNYQSQEKRIPSTPRTIYVLPSNSGPLIPAPRITNSAPGGTIIRHAYTLPSVIPKVDQKSPMKVVRRVVAQPLVLNQMKTEEMTKEDIISEVMGEHSGPSGPRRRERLTHLTPEQKMDRRKMKNRMAAQIARDRKKEKSQKMEDVMRDLVTENRRLRQENQRLRYENQQLQRHQKAAADALRAVEKQQDQLLNGTLESAEFISEPLLREQVRQQSTTLLNNGKKTSTASRQWLILLSLFHLMKAEKIAKQSEATNWRKSRRLLKISRATRILTSMNSSATCPPTQASVRFHRQPPQPLRHQTMKQSNRVP